MIVGSEGKGTDPRVKAVRMALRAVQRHRAFSAERDNGRRDRALHRARGGRDLHVVGHGLGRREVEMICETCRKGADLLPSVQKIDASLVKTRSEAFEMIEEFHAACQGGSWCDCQHKIRSEVPA